MKCMKGRSGVDSNGSSSHVDGSQSAFAHFASSKPMSSHSVTCCSMPNNCSGSWIIDTGASDHMIFDQVLFKQHTKSSKLIFVNIPNGTSKPVTKIGQISLTPDRNLQNVLFIPDFKYNFLSVSQLITNNNMCVTFYPDTCVFQDLSTRR